MTYVYSFVVWPDEQWPHDHAIFDLFRVLTARVEMHFTEGQFSKFRVQLGRGGFTLREVTRRPYIAPESMP